MSEGDRVLQARHGVTDWLCPAQGGRSFVLAENRRITHHKDKR